MQNNSIFDNTLIFFQDWSGIASSLFNSRFFLFFFSTTIINLNFVNKFNKSFSNQLRRKSLKVLFFCNPNYLVHQNFKNASMGNGNGSPMIWVYNPDLTNPFSVVSGMNSKSVQSIALFFSLHLSKHIGVSSA